MPFNDASENLSLVSVPGSESWETGEDIIYLNGPYFICVPTGFKTDLASIPGAFRWLVSNDDHRVRRPAIVHDWIYVHDGQLGHVNLSRRQTDDLFYEALIEEGVSRFKATLMWLVVRAGGWAFWSEENS